MSKETPSLGRGSVLAAMLGTAVVAGDPWAADRGAMIERDLRGRGIRNQAVLAAMAEVPRHLFVPPARQPEAYADRPLPIGGGQTISQPYVVALMTELLEPTGKQRILEIGTGSGYHAAVLSRVVAEVYTIEIVPELGQAAAHLLSELGYGNVHVRIGDGYDGWPEAAPFDGVLLTAAPPSIPQPLLDQVAIGGRLVVPLGVGEQDLLVLTRTAAGFERRVVAPVRFVPMTGKAQAAAEGAEEP